MQQKLDIYLAYAHEDELLRNELVKHLSVLILEGVVSMWCDRDIHAGTEKQPQIDMRLSVAHLILLLISPAFMASEYSASVEVKRAMERHMAGQARVIPVILRPVIWKPAAFGMLQPLPTNGEPVVSSNWHSRDDAFLDIAEGIRVVVKELLTSTSTTSRSTITKPFRKTKEQWIEEVDVYYRVKQYTKALVAAEQALAIDPNFIDAHYLKGIIFRGLNRNDDALAVFEYVIQLAPNYAQAYNGMGNIFLEREDYGKALALYDQALMLTPNLIDAYANKGEALRRLNRNQEALTAFDRALALNPNFVNAYIGQGATLRQLDQQEEALKILERAIGLDPNALEAYNGKGIVLSMLKRHEEAIATYDLAIELDPNFVAAYRNKASLLRFLGKHKEAALVYDKLGQLERQ